MSAKKNVSEVAFSEFRSECEEITQRVFLGLEKISKQGPDPETIDSVYRDIHTLKGSSQLYAFQQLGQLAHAMETSLDPVRKKRGELSKELQDSLIECLNVIDRMVKGLSVSEEPDYQEHLKRVIPPLVESSLSSVGLGGVLQRELAGLKEDFSSYSAPTAKEEKIEEGPRTEPADVAARIEEKTMEPLPVAPETPEIQSPSTDLNSTIRVSVGLLDKLMTLTGEMVLVRNQVLQYSSQSDDLQFLNLSQRLDLVTSELQSEIMKTRMQPIGNVLMKLKRVIHELSKELGKKIELELFGTETELDKTLLEAIKDPLTHIVRNACDHGLESGSDRLAVGKSESGTLTIRAFHEGGQVIIEISDDGRGLQKQKILKRAIDRGLTTNEAAKQLSESDIQAFIFRPGFSTAETITNVSGRGVGMDVVRTNIEKIGGTVDIRSVEGRGTSFSLRIPLTLAIVPAMIVECASRRYAIPQVKLVELLRVEPDDEKQIELLQGRPVYRLRGKLLPLIQLSEVLGLKVEETASTAKNIVVVSTGSSMCGIIVDNILDKADIVVKPLSSFLNKLAIYSGSTVLGDGSVALILDVTGIMQKLSISQEATDRSAETSKETKAQALNEYLLFRLNASSKHAIPLKMVDRLEEFKRTQLEFSGGVPVVRYRGSILPILNLNEKLQFQKSDEGADSLHVIVAKNGKRQFGIQVNEILDVLATDARVDNAISDREGVAGNFMTEEEIVVVVDVLKLLEKSGIGSSQLGLDREKWRVVVVEDNSFFRSQIVKTLQGVGYEVLSAPDGEAGLELMRSLNPRTPTAIISDIEMPKMNGFDLARNLRNDPKWRTTPLIAFTSCFNEEYVQKGEAAGFHRYLEKSNMEDLLSRLDELLESQGV